MHIYIIAGEPSGDILGARIMLAVRALAQARGVEVRFSGVGGAQMMAAGLESLFDMQEISLMGLAEVLPHVFQVRRRIKETVADVVARQPDILLTIDAPGFCKRVAAQVKAVDNRIRRIHYVAPTVWAWRPGRAKQMAALFQRLLVLLPFEPPYFTKEGLPCDFVGHPVLESGADKGDAARFIKKYKLEGKGPRIGILPGSRGGELDKHLPILQKTLPLLQQRYPNAVFVVPTLPHLEGRVREALQAFDTAGLTSPSPSRDSVSLSALEEAFPEIPAAAGRTEEGSESGAQKQANPKSTQSLQPAPSTTVVVTSDLTEKYDAFAAMDVAAAASGTVGLEIAMAGVPHLIFYRVNPLTGFLVRRMVNVSHVSLINLLCQTTAVPELLQQQANPKAIFEQTVRLLENEDMRAEQQEAYKNALRQLGQDRFVPSERVAELLLEN